MSYSNPAAKLGWGTRNLSEGGEYPLTRLTNDYMLMLSLYRGSWIIRKVVDVMAEDMLKDFPRITTELPPDVIKQFDKVVADTSTESKILEALKWSRLFGGGVALICIAGHNDLSKPLLLDDVLPGSYRGLIAMDRWSGVYPDMELITDLDHISEFGLPAFYECDMAGSPNKIKVHHTRLLRFSGRDLPIWEKQAQIFWGLSEVELVFDELRKRDYTSWNIVSLMTRANIMTIREPQLAAALSGSLVSNDALTQYVAKIQAISDTMSNQGLLALPADGGLEANQYSFGGIAEVYNTFMLDVAGACEIPVSRLYGRTITGLGQSGEGDLQIYYDTVEQKRKRELRPQLNKLIPVIAMSAWGVVPEDLDYSFPPVRTLTDKDKSDLAKSNSDAVIAAFNAGLISQKTALQELRQQADRTDLFSNITQLDIDKADDEVQQMGELGSEDPFSELAKEKQPKKKAA